MSKRVGVLRFPGTNCDRDVYQAVGELGHEPVWLWHQDQFDWKNFKALVLPGGFSYGDYLRSGALAARAPAMQSTREAVKHGVPVLGICNGFQILTEAGILPGSLLKNEKGRFVDRWVDLSLKTPSPYFGARQSGSQKIQLPVAHGDGRFFAVEDEIKKLQDNQQVWWSYGENPNGSCNNIAGVLNKEKNVCALMPHPERAIYEWHGQKAGRDFFALEF